jgi:hypothetical protein
MRYTTITLCIIVLCCHSANTQTIDHIYLQRLADWRTNTIALNPAGTTELGTIIAELDAKVQFGMGNMQYMPSRPIYINTNGIRPVGRTRSGGMRETSMVQTRDETGRIVTTTLGQLTTAEMERRKLSLENDAFHQAMAANPALAHLLYESYLEAKYPFKIAADQPHLAEMRFFEFKPGDLVASTECDGMRTATDLALSTDSVTLYQCDCTESEGEGASVQRPASPRSETPMFLLDEETTTILRAVPDPRLSQHLPWASVDHVIMRVQTYHMPFAPIKIVEGKAVLKPNGSFFVVAERKSKQSHRYGQQSPTSVKKIVKEMQSRGFALVRQGEHTYAHLLEFRLTSR